MKELLPVISVRPLYLALVAVPFCAVLLVAVGAAVAFARYETAYEGRVYPGVAAFGVDLSERTSAEARDLLAARAAQIASQPVVLAYGGQQWSFTASELGVEVNVDPLVERALLIGRQGDLLQRAWTVLQVGQRGLSLGAVDPTFNRQPAAHAVRTIASEIDRPVVNADMVVTPSFEVEVTRAQIGVTVDQDESLRRVLLALERGDQVVELVGNETAPTVTDEQVVPAAQLARNVLDGRLLAFVGDRTWALPEEEMQQLLRVERRGDGSFEVDVAREPLLRFAEQVAAEVEQTPVDAKFEWAGGRLEVIRPSRDGLSMDPQQAMEAIARAALGPTNLVELPVEVTRPAVPMDEELGIVELIEHSSTSFAGSVAAKKHNIRLAAERINGTVVPPGGTFSFNEAVGPTTLAAGFQWGFGILGGEDGHRTVPSVAGGICQVSTTLFHTVFWGGYTVLERYPHFYWIPSYTTKGVVGLDTTVAEEYGLDFRFSNPSEHHVLVRAWVDNADQLHFALYSTKPSWTVQVAGPFITNNRPTDPAPREQEDANMDWGQRIVVEAARDGFDARVIRTVTYGDETRELAVVSRYEASYNVTLVGIRGRPKPTPTPTPDPTESVDEAHTEQPEGEQVEAAETPVPEAEPTPAPEAEPTPAPEAEPTPAPEAEPTPAPEAEPTPELSVEAAAVEPTPTPGG